MKIHCCKCNKKLNKVRVDFSIETPGCPMYSEQNSKGENILVHCLGLTGHSAQSCELPGQVSGKKLMAPAMNMHVSLIEH